MSFPPTREGAVAWAEARFQQHPTRTDRVWDATAGKLVEVVSPNTVELILADVVKEWLVRNYVEWKKSELLGFVLDTMWDGTKGLKNSTREELLEEIDNILEIQDEGDGQGGSIYQCITEFTPFSEIEDGNG
jgi:hypothetical protein